MDLNSKSFNFSIFNLGAQYFVLSVKPNPSDISKVLNTNNSTIKSLVEIANVFNNCFS